MKRTGTLVGIIISLALCVHAEPPGEEEDVPPGQYRFAMSTLDGLSDHNVSRLGDTALNLKTVQWQHGESDHFVFHTETGFSTHQLAIVAEWSYEQIKKHLEIPQDLFERKCHVYVFLNEQAWREFVDNDKRESWTGGWCTGKELFFCSRPHFRFQGTTLPHELTHLVLHRFVNGDIPLWLNEGLAEFEGIRLYRLYLKERRYKLVNVRDRLDRSEYIALKDLTTAVDYPRTKEEVAAFYTESQRLINFLYEDHGGINPLLKFLKLQGQGARFDSAWRESYGSKYSDNEAFEARFISYLTTGRN